MTKVNPAAPVPADSQPAPTEPGPATAQPESAPTLLDALRRSGRPLLLTVRKKKRRRYTKGLRGLQKDLEMRARTSTSLLSALAAGSEKYEKRARASAQTRRDGVLRDHWKNSAAALRTAVRKSSKAISSSGVRDVVLLGIAQAVASAKRPNSPW